jgi:hypothetical protein
MTFASDQKIGQALLTIVEKVTGNNFTLNLDLNFDVPLDQLTDWVAMNFAAGEGFTRHFTDPVTGDDIGSFTWDQSARRIYTFWKSGAAGAMDMGLTLFENGVHSGDTIELHHR